MNLLTIKSQRLKVSIIWHQRKVKTTHSSICTYLSRVGSPFRRSILNRDQELEARRRKAKLKIRATIGKDTKAISNRLEPFRPKIPDINKMNWLLLVKNYYTMKSHHSTILKGINYFHELVSMSKSWGIQ